MGTAVQLPPLDDTLEQTCHDHLCERLLKEKMPEHPLTKSCKNPLDSDLSAMLYSNQRNLFLRCDPPINNLTNNFPQP